MKMGRRWGATINARNSAGNACWPCEKSRPHFGTRMCARNWSADWKRPKKSPFRGIWSRPRPESSASPFQLNHLYVTRRVEIFSSFFFGRMLTVNLFFQPKRALMEQLNQIFPSPEEELPSLILLINGNHPLGQVQEQTLKFWVVQCSIVFWFIVFVISSFGWSLIDWLILLIKWLIDWLIARSNDWLIWLIDLKWCLVGLLLLSYLNCKVL